MTKDEFLEKIKEIGIVEDDVSRRTLLAEMTDSITKVYDDIEANNSTINSLNETISKNNADMEKLREANMSLFLRLGSNKTSSEVLEDTTGIKTETKEKRKFEDLFKSKERDE